VLAIVAFVVFRMALGVISAVFWLVAVAVLIVAALWAVKTLRSGRSRRQVAPPPPEDPVEAQMRKIQQQLRDQGRL
jgi:hypothetical protein